MKDALVWEETVKETKPKGENPSRWQTESKDQFRVFMDRPDRHEYTEDEKLYRTFENGDKEFTKLYG